MAFEHHVPLTGSEKPAPKNCTKAEAVNAEEKMTVTVILQRQSALPNTFVPFAGDATAFGSEYGASPADVQKIEQFAHRHHLAVVESSIAKRRVKLTGSAKDMKGAFGAQLHYYRNLTTGQMFRGRTGQLTIPSELQTSVMAVLGLDNRPQARAHFVVSARASVDTSFTPPQIAALYKFPTGVTGAGQTIGIIELGGGYTAADLTTYFGGLGIPEPNIVAVAVDAGSNTPGGDADGEVLLDIEVAGSIAPGANLVVYFADNTDQGFIDAITDAAHDTARKVSIISISWGGPEDSWTTQSISAMNAALQDAAALGVTVTIASGDNGSTDGETDGKLHVDFPASSPYALACGGTKLTAANNAIKTEVVWNETANQEGATGGGVSVSFAIPSYQSSAGVPKNPNTGFAGRGVPDVSGNADPTTGYLTLVDGKQTVVGGTSAVAPLWAALVALMNQKLGRNLGFLNPAIYALKEKGFHDISKGNNDDSNLGHYTARTGWDACTGLGSPNGAALLSALTSNTSAKSGG